MPQGDTDSRSLAEWTSLHANLIWVYAGTPPDYARRAWVTAPFYSAYYVYSGRLLIRDEQDTLLASSGDWLMPRQGWRWQECAADTRLLSLRFKAKWTTGEDLFSRQPALRLSAEDVPGLKPAADALHDFVIQRWGERQVDMLSAPADLEAHLGLQSRLHVWLTTWASTLVRFGAEVRRCQQPDERLRRVIEHLDSLPLKDGPSPETHLAQMANLSGSHLNRLFRRDLQMTPREYLDRRKLAAAVLAVEDGAQAFKEISIDLGFSSPPHFTRWFTRHTGLTPQAYRARARAHPRGGLPDALAKRATT